MRVLERRSREREKPRHESTGRKQGFFDRVYALVSRIPYGRVATYGQIARMLGAPRAARIVGWAMHDNPHGSRVPCHRVIQRGGTCSPNFHIGDPEAQRRLLEEEGVQFLLGGRVDLEVHQWRPEMGNVPSRRRGKDPRNQSQKGRP
jgi:methylated-DNA-protein-cysteine methyltransferase-like protein